MFSGSKCAERWIDINFWSHQVSLHLVDDLDVSDPTNSVDSDAVPGPTFWFDLGLSQIGRHSAIG